ncbi:MAG: hypothetical protein FWG47_05390 [Propionibacteriaceae bacterium]|nr:hypothetical protein [Propionibacteriaceae bacterium]
MNRCMVCEKDAVQKVPFVFAEGKKLDYEQKRLKGVAYIGLCVDCFAKESDGVVRKAVRKSSLAAIGIFAATIIGVIALASFLDSGNNGTLIFLLMMAGVIGSVIPFFLVIKPTRVRRKYRRGRVDSSVYIRDCVDELVEKRAVLLDAYERATSSGVLTLSDVIFNWEILRSLQIDSTKSFEDPNISSAVRSPIQCGHDTQWMPAVFETNEGKIVVNDVGDLPLFVCLVGEMYESSDNTQSAGNRRKALLAVQNYLVNVSN